MTAKGDSSWYQRNRERVLAKHSERMKDPAFREERKAYLKEYRKRPGVYEKELQAGRRRIGIKNPLALAYAGHCQICGKWGESLCCDHDHSTGEARGWLCHQCNAGLGQFKDRIDLMQLAVSYLLIWKK